MTTKKTAMDEKEMVKHLLDYGKEHEKKLDDNEFFDQTMNKRMHDMLSKKVIYEKDNDMLVYDEKSHDLIWISDDTVNHIEATDSLFERFRIISYFGEFLPVEALGIVVAKVKGQI